MSRSYRKAIIKDGYKKSSAGYKSKKRSSSYWRVIRSRINQEVREEKFDTLSVPREIINDWSYNDHCWKKEYSSPYIYFKDNKEEKEKEFQEDLKKYRRK